MARLAEYTIQIRDTSDNLLDVLRVVQSAKYRLAENEVGDFSITIPYGNGKFPALLVPPNRVEFYRDGTFVFGGVLRFQAIDQEGAHPFYSCSGPSYMTWLADTRNQSATGTGDIVYTSAHLDDVMKNVVTSQVLDHNSNFVVEPNNSLSTTSDTYTASGYETVLETLQGIATRAGDTSFDIVRDVDKVLRFKTYTPSRGPDHSKGNPDAVLFDLRGGNLQKLHWERDGTSVVNAMWGAGGPSTGAARYVYPVGDAITDAASILDWGRIEGFIDSGNDSTTATDKKVQDELKKQSVPKESVSFSISEFGRYKLGTDFDYGTRVTVIWPPILEYTDTIKGIQVSIDEGSSTAGVDINIGDTITGDESTRAMLRLGRFLREIRRTQSIVTRR